MSLWLIIYYNNNLVKKVVKKQIQVQGPNRRKKRYIIKNYHVTRRPTQ